MQLTQREECELVHMLVDLGIGNTKLRSVGACGRFDRYLYISRHRYNDNFCRWPAMHLFTCSKLDQKVPRARSERSWRFTNINFRILSTDPLDSASFPTVDATRAAVFLSRAAEAAFETLSLPSSQLGTGDTKTSETS